MNRLDKSPYFSELPFTVKANIADPIVDMRVHATNLKRAIKPCLVHVQDPTPIALPKTLISGFI
jgi:hypothetical protein